jgi:hypothetical protein
MLAAQLG